MTNIELELSNALNKIANEDENKMFAPSKNKYEDFKVGNKVKLYHYWMMEDDFGCDSIRSACDG